MKEQYLEKEQQSTTVLQEKQHLLAMKENECQDLTRFNEGLQLELQTKVATFDQEINKYEIQVQQLQEELEKLKETQSVEMKPQANTKGPNTAARWKSQLTIKDKQIKILQDAIVLLKQELIDSYEKNTKQSEPSAVQRELESQVAFLQSELQATREDKKQAEHNYHQLKEAHNKITAEYMAEKEKLDSQIEKLSLDMQKAQKIINSQKGKIEKLQKDIDTLPVKDAQQFQELEKKYKSLLNTVTAKPGTQNNKKSEMNSTVQQGEELIQVKDQLSKQQVALQATQDELTALHESQKEIVMENARLKKLAEVERIRL